MSIGLYEILSLIDEYEMDRTRPCAYQVLYERYPLKQVDAKFDKIYRKGYIECGVSVRTGWLTPKGYAKLQELRNSKNEWEIREKKIMEAVVKAIEPDPTTPILFTIRKRS